MVVTDLSKRKFFRRFCYKYISYLESNPLSAQDSFKKSWLTYFLRRTIFIRLSYLLQFICKTSLIDLTPYQLALSSLYILGFLNSLVNLFKIFILSIIYLFIPSDDSCLRKISKEGQTIILYDEEVASIFSIFWDKDRYIFKNYVYDILKLYKEYNHIVINTSEGFISLSHDDNYKIDFHPSKHPIYIEVINFNRLIKALRGFVGDIFGSIMLSRSLFPLCCADYIMKSKLMSSIGLTYEILITKCLGFICFV